MSQPINIKQIRQNLARARQLLNDKYPNQSISLVDELIKERREEAKREMEEYEQYAKGVKASLFKNEE